MTRPISTRRKLLKNAARTAAAAAFVAGKIDAIASNPDVWAKTVFILNYDENDGIFDHVAPPVPAPGTPLEFIDGLPIGGGFVVFASLFPPGPPATGSAASPSTTPRFSSFPSSSPASASLISLTGAGEPSAT